MSCLLQSDVHSAASFFPSLSRTTVALVAAGSPAAGAACFASASHAALTASPISRQSSSVTVLPHPAVSSTHATVGTTARPQARTRDLLALRLADCARVDLPARRSLAVASRRVV